MRPFSTSGIDSLPKWLDAGGLDRIDEQFIPPLPQIEIGRSDAFDDFGHFGIRNCRSDQRAKLRILVGFAAQRDLIKLFAVLFDAENADVADMMVAASVDAAGNIDMQTAEIALPIEIVEAPC